MFSRIHEAIKKPLKKDEGYYIEMMAMLAFLCASIVASFFALIYMLFYLKNYRVAFYQLLNLFFYFGYFNTLLQRGTTQKRIAILVGYNFAVFSILWSVLSFRNQGVVAFYLATMVLNIIILSQKLKSRHLILLFCLGDLLLLIDYFIRDTIRPNVSYYSLMLMILFYHALLLTVLSQVKGYRRVVGRVQYNMYRDALTKIKNIRAFYKDLDETIHHSRFSNRDFSIVFIDLNDFKLINDQYGHMIGDKVLAQVAQFLKRAMMPNDNIYRIGGDEFIIMFPNEVMTKDIFLNILETALSHETDLGGLSLSLSFGISNYFDADGNRETMIKKADAEMYRAKSSYKSSKAYTRNSGIFTMPDMALRTRL